jgi:hypothetical protein
MQLETSKAIATRTQIEAIDPIVATRLPARPR